MPDPKWGHHIFYTSGNKPPTIESYSTNQPLVTPYPVERNISGASTSDSTQMASSSKQSGPIDKPADNTPTKSTQPSVSTNDTNPDLSPPG